MRRVLLLRSRTGHRAAAVVVVAIAVGGTFLASLTTSSAGIPPRPGADFQRLTKHPVAGHVFNGLAITNLTGLRGGTEPFTSVRCDAAIGGKRLRARHLIYGKPRPGRTQVVVCAWLIPSDAAGKTLRLWKYEGHVPGAVVHLYGEEDFSDPFTWYVVKR